MVVNELTPTQAALIARGVYRLREDSVSTMRERGQNLGCEDMFQTDDASRFQGRSGSLAWKRLSGFGYIANGTGIYQNDVLLVTRGTAMAVDWLTNFNIGMQKGPGGHLVHAGFNETWKSFRSDVSDFMKGKNPACIHCVGHSLGGALAALNADYLSTLGAGQVKLYTFGSPRAGSFLFSRALTNRLGSNNIYRVSHPSDPVPMIPIFPFQHLPHNIQGLTVSNALGGLINPDAHGMAESYIPGVDGKAWNNLLMPAEPGWDGKAKAWLEHSVLSGNGFVMGSAKLLIMIGQALFWILKKSKDILIGAVGTALAVGATIIDQLAWLLGRAADLSKEIAGYVTKLIAAIFRFLGRTASSTVSITITFLRWVLDLLFTALSAGAVRALARVR